jgi:hypothetical protein
VKNPPQSPFRKGGGRKEGLKFFIEKRKNVFSFNVQCGGVYG